MLSGKQFFVFDGVCFYLCGYHFDGKTNHIRLMSLADYNTDEDKVLEIVNTFPKLEHIKHIGGRTICTCAVTLSELIEFEDNYNLVKFLK